MNKSLVRHLCVAFSMISAPAMTLAQESPNNAGDAVNPAYRKPASYQFNYKISGDAQVLPSQVFDDGKRTYLQFGNKQTPAIFSALTQGEVLLEYQSEPPYIVLRNVEKKLLFRSGSHTAIAIYQSPDRALDAVATGMVSPVMESGVATEPRSPDEIARTKLGASQSLLAADKSATPLTIVATKSNASNVMPASDGGAGTTSSDNASDPHITVKTQLIQSNDVAAQASSKTAFPVQAQTAISPYLNMNIDPGALELKAGDRISDSLRIWLANQGWTLLWKPQTGTRGKLRDFVISDNSIQLGDIESVLNQALTGKALAIQISLADKKVLVTNASAEQPTIDK